MWQTRTERYKLVAERGPDAAARNRTIDVIYDILAIWREHIKVYDYKGTAQRPWHFGYTTSSKPLYTKLD